MIFLRRRYLLGILFLYFGTVATAQIADTSTVEVPDLKIPAATEKSVFQPSPKKAILWSIIPGGGQVYNRRLWKVPLVVGGISAMVAVIDYNQTNYHRFADAYVSALANEPHEFTGVLDASRIKSFRDNFNRTRQLSYFYLVGMYGLQGVEALVDAHLQSFDIEDDLGGHWQLSPTFISTPTLPLPSLALQMRLTF